MSAPQQTWPNVKLSDILELKYGKALPKKVRRPGAAQVFGSSGEVDRHDEALLANPAIIVGRKGSIGSVFLTDGPSWPIDTAYYVSHDPLETDLRWLFHRLNALPLIDMNKSAAVPGLNREDVYRLKISLPPLPEQRRIAAILDKASNAAEGTATALSQTQPFTGTLFQKEFANFDSDRAVLAEVLAAKLTNGKSPASEGAHRGHVFTLSAVTSGRFLPEQRKEAWFDKEPAAGQYASSDHFLISRGNGNIDMVGVGVVANGSENDVVFPDTVIGAPINREVVEPEFLEAAWASPSVRTQIRAAARTTNGTFKVNQTSLGKVEFPLPPLETQRKFTRQVQYARRTEESLMRRKARMSRLITALQSRAFRGDL